jgi:hypothetical protein
MTESTDTKPLLGRCKEKGCDYALFATDADVKPGESLRDVTAGTGVYRVNNGFVARCTSGHKVFVLSRIKGTYSADHKCDSRCLNARGHACTCSCGGMNHGRGHAVAVVAVEKREPQYIGEVGKFIKGTATVSYVKELSSSTLYKFTTDKGDLIVWFAPDFVTDSYEQGERVTFRAKVKAHEDKGYGKQTVVTYFEPQEDQS